MLLAGGQVLGVLYLVTCVAVTAFPVSLFPYKDLIRQARRVIGSLGDMQMRRWAAVIVGNLMTQFNLASVIAFCGRMFFPFCSLIAAPAPDRSRRRSSRFFIFFPQAGSLVKVKPTE